MQNDLNKDLDIFKVTSDSYKSIGRNLLAYIILCYVFMLPIYAIQYFKPFESLSIFYFKTASFTLDHVLVILLINAFTIFCYRLFIFGKSEVLKISVPNFAKAFLKTFLYYIALAAVLILAILSVGLLFGLVISIINSVAGEAALNQETVSFITTSFMSLFLLLASIRVQPTFVSIAKENDHVPMKSAYYYTRENNRKLAIIGVLTFILSLIIVRFASEFILSSGILGTNSIFIITLILSPFALLPITIYIACGIRIYNDLEIDEQRNPNIG